MRFGLYVSKALGLIKTIGNPFFFLYRVCHYLNCYVPHSLASYICRKNRKEYKKEGVRDFLLDTYDGSGQAVHPDIVFWNKLYWMVLTPYPYGMEEYENPCVYCGESLNALSVPNRPIAFPHKHAHGIHLSDPCFTKQGDTLFCFYRESERHGQTEEQKIWETRFIALNNTWSEPQLIMSSYDDMILSPAMLYDQEGRLNVFYVSSLNGFKLVRKCVGSNKNDVDILNINGLPEGLDLWHLGISRMADIVNSELEGNRLMGLFSVKSKQKGGGLRLFEALSTNFGQDWIVTKEVMIPKDLKSELLFPYKSCYVPFGNGTILLSFRDKKSRNRLSLIKR